MPRKKKELIEGDNPPVENTPVEETDETLPELPEVTKEPVVEESQEKKDFRRHIAIYKEQHPLKYAQKEKALLDKLNSLV